MKLSRAIAFGVAVSLVVPVIPAVAQYSPDTITVTAPRNGPRSPGGEPTEIVSHSIKTSTAGLDLSTPAGLQALEPRVREAAKKSCGWLDQHYPVVDKKSDCETSAVNDAMTRARAKGGAR